MIGKLPALDPKYFWWSGDRAYLRYMIEKWHKNLARYSPQMALNFLKGCMHKDWHYIMENSETLEECLETFGTYAASEDLLLRKMMERMKSYPFCRN